MKYLITSFLLLTAFTAEAQTQDKQIMRFWDSTFAYNMMIVSEYSSQNNLLHIEVTGSSIGLGEQMAGVTPGWSPEDHIHLYIPKSDCQIDETAKTVHCERKVPTGTTITWAENPAVTRTFHWSIKNIVIDANPSKAVMQFNIEDNPYFQSAIETPKIEIDVRSVD